MKRTLIAAVVVLVAVLVGSLWPKDTPAQSPAQPMAWEYLVYDRGGDKRSTAEVLKDFGSDGWELAAATQSAPEFSPTLYFKRPKAR